MGGSDDHYNRTVAIFVGLFVGFGGFLYGYDTGYISDEFIRTFGQQDENGDWYLPSSTDSLITSILSLGTLGGALASAYIAMWLGRRWGLGLYVVVFGAGVAMQTAGYSVALFSVGRAVAGFGVGGVSCVIPSYQSEVAPAKWRGAVTTTYAFFIGVGLTMAAVIVWATKDIEGDASFMIPIGLQLAFAAIIGAGLFVLPESPRWCIVKGKEQQARKSLAYLMRSTPDSDIVSMEIATIIANVEHERSQGTVSYRELLWRSGDNRLPLRVWTGILFQSFQQLSGINFIFYYGTTFFANSGISNPFIIVIATNVVHMGSAIPGMRFATKIRRRPLVIWGSIGMTVSQLVVGFTGTFVSADNVAANKVLVAFVCIYIFHFGSIWGPMSWYLTAEIVPNAARSKSVSLTTGANWTWNFILGFITPYLVDNAPGSAGLGPKVFFIWGSCCLVSIFYGYFMVPEVKDLTLEQVDLLYRHSTVLKSTSHRRKLLADGVTEGCEYDTTFAEKEVVDQHETADVKHV